MKYRFSESEQITAKSIRAFLSEFLEGKLQPYFKSEDVPESSDSLVKVIVGSQFKEMVLESNKDVFIKFYAPWCGHCKALAPIFEEVAMKLKENENILLAECDATANEFRGVNIQTYPTLIFWKSGSKEKPILYEGERNV